MTKDDLKVGVIENLDFAKGFYEDASAAGQGLSTMFITSTSKNGKRNGVAALIGDKGALENRRDISFDLGIRAGIELAHGDIDSIDAIYMISEAWFSTAMTKGESNFTRPSEDLNRKEAIISVGVSQEGDKFLEIFEIKKTFDMEKGKIQVEFNSLNNEMPNSTVDSPLLDCFWDGVKLLASFQEKLPKEFEDIFKKLPVDVLFTRFISQINEIRKK